MFNVNISMKNNDKIVIRFENKLSGMKVEEFLTTIIFDGYSKKNDININCFEKEDGESVAINLEEISSIEYGFKAVE